MVVVAVVVVVVVVLSLSVYSWFCLGSVEPFSWLMIVRTYFPVLAPWLAATYSDSVLECWTDLLFVAFQVTGHPW